MFPSLGSGNLSGTSHLPEATLGQEDVVKGGMRTFGSVVQA